MDTTDSPLRQQAVAARDGQADIAYDISRGRVPELKPVDGKSWARTGEVYTRIGDSMHGLPPGVYTCGVSPQTGPYLHKVKNDTDSLVRMPDGPTEEVLKEILQFQGLRETFKKYGFLHKRGILMYGPPGSGKTVTLQFIIDLLVNQLKGIALYLENPGAASVCMQMVRELEPNRQIVGIMEDFDNLIKVYNASSWLSLMDGEHQVDNVVFVATTNYPEQIDKRFVDRPSRFDLIKHVGLPSVEAMKAYLRAKLPDLPERDVSAFARVANKGQYTIAHLKELIILTHCFGYALGDAADRIRNARTAIMSSDKDPNPKTRKTGFGAITVEPVDSLDDPETGEDGLPVRQSTETFYGGSSLNALPTP